MKVYNWLKGYLDTDVKSIYYAPVVSGTDDDGEFLLAQYFTYCRDLLMSSILVDETQTKELLIFNKKTMVPKLFKRSRSFKLRVYEALDIVGVGHMVNITQISETCIRLTFSKPLREIPITVSTATFAIKAVSDSPITFSAERSLFKLACGYCRRDVSREGILGYISDFKNHIPLLDEIVSGDSYLDNSERMCDMYTGYFELMFGYFDKDVYIHHSNRYFLELL